MRSLREVQRQLGAAVFDASVPTPDFVLAADLTSAQRLAIYRGSIYGNFRAALGDVYPVVKRLIGATCFDSAAMHFIQEIPSASGDIHHFGVEFSQFLRIFPATADLIYLPDVARLEWQMHELYYAAEPPALDIAALAALPEHAHGNLTFTLTPACRLLASAYPIDRIWQTNQPEVIEPEEIHLDTGGVQLLVRRRDGVLELQLLCQAAYVLLEQLHAGACFSDALQAALAVQADFDVVPFLLYQVQLGTLVDFRSAHNNHGAP